MRSKFWTAFCAALLLSIPASVLATVSELGCEGPLGPVFGTPDPGLYTADLISDGGDIIGTVEAYNTSDDVYFTFKPNADIDLTVMQLWIGKDLDSIPVKKKTGKPIFSDFPWERKLKLDFGQEYTFSLNLNADLDFYWRGQSHQMGFMLHGDFVDTLDNKDDFMAKGFCEFPLYPQATYSRVLFHHPDRGQFIDSPVVGLNYHGPTQMGVTKSGELDGGGGFLFFPGEIIEFSIGEIVLGDAMAAKKVSPLDLFSGADINDPRVIDVARILQTLDADRTDGKITLLPEVVAVFNEVAQGYVGPDGKLAFGDESLDVYGLLMDTVLASPELAGLPVVDADEAQGNLEAGLNASGIFRKNISKTEDFGESKQKLEVMPVYIPGKKSNGDPSLCIDVNDDGIYDEGEDTLGVPYEEWRLDGDPLGLECDPRVDGEACVVTLIECRELVKPVITTYTEGIDIYNDPNVKYDFWPDRFSTDIVTAISRDDGTTWKRMNVSRMADLSSFDLDTGEPFPGTSSSSYLKVNDNKILNVWQSKFCRSGNPRYSINLCDDPETEEVEADDPLTEENECAIYCRGNPDEGTEVCEADYPYDDDYYVTDIWGVRGKQRSVDYDEVDDVAELGIGEIPYSCLWAARGVIVTEKELVDGTFDSLRPEDDPATEEDESDVLEVGDIVWFKPERLTSGRRDAYIPAAASARGSGFAIAWQEDPDGLRPGKGKGPGMGWSGAISNNKSDIWYSFISYDDFNIVDENFVPGSVGNDPNGEAANDDRPGLGRPKALVPFSLPVRISDNDMVNANTLKVVLEGDECTITDTDIADSCFPVVEEGSFVPLLTDEIALLFCETPGSDPATCCDHENHETDPNCEGLNGLHGNLTGTKRYAYMAKTIDDDGDGAPDYQYFVDNGGTLDLCDTSAENLSMTELPGTAAHERWYGFVNNQGSSKLVCVTSDGRVLDGDTSASRPNIQMQPYTKPDGTKSAWVLLGYEESKGMGHAPTDSHDNPVDEIIGDADDDTSGQEKPIKQDLGKNVIYHSFDFAQPDLVSPGHIVNLPALCGGLYPNYCDDPKTPDIIETNEDNPTCSCEPGQPIPLYFDYFVDTDGDPDTPGEWIPDDSVFMQYRTEIARRTRFIMQSGSKAAKFKKAGGTGTLGSIIYKQGQEGQGRPADVFIRRLVLPDGIDLTVENPFAFENFECTTYLDETFIDLPGCPTDNVVGYNCNVWGEAYGDRLCGGLIDDTTADGVAYTRRDHINLTSANIDLAVDAGPVDDTPDDPTDDRYGTNKVLLWSQHEENLGDESYGLVKEDGTACDVLAGEVCPAMYSNSRSHRGFIRGDFMIAAYALSPNWAAGRNGNDRYNFYVRRSFDGGQTWTTTPADLGGVGVYVCPEYRSDPTSPDPDGSGNLPPEVFDATCGTYDYDVPEGELPPMPVGVGMSNYADTMVTTADGLPAQFIAAGAFEPARNLSEIKNNKETSSDPRVGATPPTYPLDGTVNPLKNLCPKGVCVNVEDTYIDNIFFVAWGTGDNVKSKGSTTVTPEAAPMDLYYTRSVDWGDHYLKIPWDVNGANSNLFGETEWRYERLAWGEEEQGECQLKATSDGSKAYSIFHQLTPEEEDPDAELTRWYPWEVEHSTLNDLWFRRVIFWPDELTTP